MLQALYLFDFVALYLLPVSLNAFLYINIVIVLRASKLMQCNSRAGRATKTILLENGSDRKSSVINEKRSSDLGDGLPQKRASSVGRTDKPVTQAIICRAKLDTPTQVSIRRTVDWQPSNTSTVLSNTLITSTARPSIATGENGQQPRASQSTGGNNGKASKN